MNFALPTNLGLQMSVKAARNAHNVKDSVEFWHLLPNFYMNKKEYKDGQPDRSRKGWMKSKGRKILRAKEKREIKFDFLNQ